MQFLTPASLEYFVNGRVMRATGNALGHSSPSGVYPVQGEDRWIALAAPEPEQWEALSGLSGRGWSHDPRFRDLPARGHRSDSNFVSMERDCHSGSRSEPRTGRRTRTRRLNS